MSFSHIASQGVNGKNPGKYSREPCWQGLAGLAGATTGMGDRNELGEFSDSPLSIFFSSFGQERIVSGASFNTCFSEHQQKQDTSPLHSHVPVAQVSRKTQIWLGTPY